MRFPKEYINVMSESPIGWECNQKSYDYLKEHIPEIKPNPILIYGQGQIRFEGLFISICEGIPDGFHPVYRDTAK